MALVAGVVVFVLAFALILVGFASRGRVAALEYRNALLAVGGYSTWLGTGAYVLAAFIFGGGLKLVPLIGGIVAGYLALAIGSRPPRRR
jgi:hypothetical protein